MTPSPSREHAHPIAAVEDLGQTVRDEGDGPTVVGQRPAHGEESGGLGIGEHGGGFVEQEHLGVGVERPQQLEPLLFADRQLAGRHVVAYVEAVSFDQSGEASPAVVTTGQSAARRPSQHQVLTGGERRHEREVLLHHGDATGSDGPGSNRSIGSPSRRTRPVVGLLQTDEDLHQRRLACSVRTEHRVDLAPSQGQIDPAQCRRPTEALSNRAHLDGIGTRPSRADPATLDRVDHRHVQLRSGTNGTSNEPASISASRSS